MGVIRVNIDSILAQSQDIDKARRMVMEAQSSMDTLCRQVDPKIQQRYQIGSKLQSASRQLSGIHGQTGRIKSTVETGASSYYSVEMKLRREAQNIADESKK